jgi:Na+-transporting methylmalonyl-CoA/oxaloacetate decarboxylase gamma subunit
MIERGGIGVLSSNRARPVEPDEPRIEPAEHTEPSVPEPVGVRAADMALAGWALVGILVRVAGLCLFFGPLLGVFIGLIFGVTLSYALCVVVTLIVLVLAAGLTSALGRVVPSEAERAAQRRTEMAARHAAERAALNADFERRREVEKARGAAAIDAIVREHRAGRILIDREREMADSAFRIRYGLRTAPSEPGERTEER